MVDTSEFFFLAVCGFNKDHKTLASKAKMLLAFDSCSKLQITGPQQHKEKSFCSSVLGRIKPNQSTAKRGG